MTGSHCDGFAFDLNTKTYKRSKALALLICARILSISRAYLGFSFKREDQKLMSLYKTYFVYSY